MRTFTIIPNDLFEDTFISLYLHPVVLASVPSVIRAAPSFLGTRPVLQAANHDLHIRAIPTGCQGAKRSGATTGTEVGIVRICVEGKNSNKHPIYICHIGAINGGVCSDI